MRLASTHRIILFALVLSLGVSMGTSDEPTADPAFEQRLTRDAVYKTRRFDTLESSAYFLYGRRSWWQRLRADNPSFKMYGASDRLPKGTQLRYRAAVVGESYVVQKGDWLVRIVEWKYGTRDHWEDVFRTNSKKLSNPNLIHPGDVLLLSRDGQVTHTGTGRVLMDAQQKLGATATAANGVRAALQRFFGLEESGWFGVGLGFGLLILVILPIFWWFYRPGEMPDLGESGSAARVRKHGIDFDAQDTHAKPEGPSVFDHAPKKSVRPKGYPYNFKKRPTEYGRPEDFAHVRDPRDTDGTLNTRPTYQTLVGRRKRNAPSRKKAA